MNPSNSPIIKAAGGILWRANNTDKTKEILMVHRPLYDDWSLPKGKVEEARNESWGDAALREVFEETSCTGRLEKLVGTASYFVGETPKIVVYWRMELVQEKDFEPNDEVDALCWTPLSKGLDLLSYATEKDVLANAFA